MILKALNDYYHRLRDEDESAVALPGYSQEKISFAIDISRDGNINDIVDLREAGTKAPRPRLMSVPKNDARTSGIKAFFLWDKTSYVLGVSNSSKRSAQEHAAFRTRQQDLLADSQDPGLRALLTFLGNWSPDQFDGIPSLVRHGNDLIDSFVCFRFDGERGFLHQRAAAQQLWSLEVDEPSHNKSGKCLVTGKPAPLARLHPDVKGVNGAQSSGASIVSFNHEAFTSYGKERGDNAPISKDAAFAYTTALNHLLRRSPDNRQRLQLGDTTVVFWAQAADAANAEQGENLLAAFFNPQDDDKHATKQLANALEQVRAGQPLRELGQDLDDDTQIFVLGLAPNASRLSIRFWETDTLARFTRRLAHHFEDLALEPAPWQRAPSPWRLALATAPIHGNPGKAKADDIPPRLAGELARAILTGQRYPQSLLATLVMRFRADGHVSGIRVALCKAVLARRQRLDQTQGEVPVSLDTENTDPGYLLGRLFATLENIQEAALGGKVNATIRDRYYGAASATPAGIYPVLLRNVQNHLAKLRKNKRGLAINLEKQIGDIVDGLPTEFPRSLPLEEQGRFAIGYYHQSKARYAQRNHDADATESAGEAA